MGESKINEAIQRAEAQNQMPVQQPDRLQKLIDWVMAGKGKRHVEVEIGKYDDKQDVEIWLWDYELLYGKHINIGQINDVDNIDLKVDKEEEQHKKYEELKAKFETEKADK